MPILRPLPVRVKAFALTGRGDFTMRKPQGVASLALGYVLHWAFSPPLLNPKLQLPVLRPVMQTATLPQR